MQQLIIEILKQLDPTENFSLIRPMIIGYLLLHPSQVLIIDTNTIKTHVHSNIRRSVFNSKLAGKDPNLLPQEKAVLGIFLSLVEMIGMPENPDEVPPVLQEPDDKIQTDIVTRHRFHSSGSFKRNSPVKMQYFDTLGLTGDLEYVITSHSSPVTHILPTLENLIVSASKDGKIFLWKLNKYDDYSKIKYREMRKDIGMRPISLGCCGDFVYIGYRNCVKL